MKRLTVSLDEGDYYRLKARVRAGEADSKSDALRDIFDEYEELHNRRDTSHDAREELHNEVQQLESQLREVRSERDELRGTLKAREDELEDLREWRNSAVGTLARTPAIEEDETLVEAVEAESDESEGSWWLFWR